MQFGCVPNVKSVRNTFDQTKLYNIAFESKHGEVRIAAVKKLTDQTLLGKIAENNTDEYIRAAAVRRLTDQTLLAKIAVDDTKKDVRIAAVKKLTDQTLLARIAVKYKKRHFGAFRFNKIKEAVRVAAVEKLTDQALLVMIATYDRNKDASLAAIEKLTDQTLLAKIVAEGYYYAALAAIEKLTDQTLLAKIVAERYSLNTTLAAIEKLTDQTLLSQLAVEDKNLNIRVTAIGKVVDQALLNQLAKNDPQAAIRKAVVKQITDDSFLIQRLSREPSASVRTSILDTLHKKDSLLLVARTAYHQDDREKALAKLKISHYDPALDVKEEHKALARRVKALATKTDSDILLTLTLEGEFDVLRVAAAQCLSNQALEQAALHSRDRDVLKILLAKLEDKAMLNRISSSANDRAMRLATAQKSGSKSWIEIFYTATARGATVQMLGDALAAVSIFPKRQPDAVNGVQHACLNLIRHGNESRIPEMVDLLEGYGDKTLAEDYLNCGQPDLDSEGQKWVHRHGLSVGKGRGSHRATWGSSR